VAILTALNIADELYKERSMDQDARQRDLEQQAKRLVNKLEEVLGDGETHDTT
jgi:cell division protein ZapA (FtsZ GTPase activity inhibitor)